MQGEYFIDALAFPLVTSTAHTMGQALDSWAWSKIPKPLVHHAASHHTPICLYGVYPHHGDTFFHEHNIAIKEVSQFSPTRSKSLNYIRPKFMRATTPRGPKIIITAMPGQDYLYHYASILRYCLHQLGKPELLSIHRNCSEENALAYHTNLTAPFIEKQSVFIMGLTHDLILYLNQHAQAHFLAQEENTYYVVWKYLWNTHTVLNILGVKYSFWGNISPHIIYKACTRQVKEVLYLGKLGTLGHPSEIFSKIFSPTSYIHLNYLSLTQVTQDVPNNIVRTFPHLNTGVHVSVSTVMERSAIQRRRIVDLGAASIDTEIAKIAQTISRYNQNHSTKIAFSAIHFASDYLRAVDEYTLNVEFDLSNHRSKKALGKKDQSLETQIKHLIQYLNIQYPL